MELRRLDKYLWLIRFFVNEYIRFLKDQDFAEEVTDQLNFVLLTTALNPDSSSTYHGLIDHMAAVFLDELTKVLGDEWWMQGEEVLLSLFFPWLQLLASSDNGSVVHHLVDELFENVVLRYVQVKSLASRTKGDSKEAKQLRASKQAFLDFITSVDEAIVELAKDAETLDRNRKALYNLHSTFQLNIYEKTGEIDKESPTKKKESNASKKRERPTANSEDVVPTGELKKSKRSETEAATIEAKRDAAAAKKEVNKKAQAQSSSTTKSKESTKSKANGNNKMKRDDDSDSSLDSNLADLDDEDALSAINNEFDSDIEDFDEDDFDELEGDFDGDDSEDDQIDGDDYDDDDGEDDIILSPKNKKNGHSNNNNNNKSSASSVKSTPPKQQNFVKMTPSKKTPPKPSSKSPSSQKSPKSSSSSPNGIHGSSKKVSFHGNSQELTERHTAKTNSPAPKSILKPTPAGPVSADISDATAINSHTDFGAFDYQIPQSQKVLSQPRRLTNADRKQLIKKTMLQAMGKKK